MAEIARSILYVHIFFGMLALFVAPAAMITHKGGLWHRRWGKVYFWAMAVVAVSAILLSVLRPQLFLPMVAVFSFYLAFTGYRVLYRKSPQHSASTLDWIGAGLMLLGGTGLLCYGIFLVRTSSFGTVAIAFGSIGLLLAISDVQAFRHPSSDKRAWWFTHIRRMLAAYIATVTAFSAVNFQFLPPVVRWLWPSVAGTLGIFAWSSYYRKKFYGTKMRSKVVK
jgi:uncharacterized membrane protein